MQAQSQTQSQTEVFFPVSFFPSTLQDIIFEVSETYSYPLDYVCCSVLSAAAVAIGNSNSIHIKTNWIEKASLFIALIGSPGVNKSAPLSWAMMPIEKREKELYKRYIEDLRDYDRLPDKEKGQVEEPKLIKTVISDATPEAVVQQLKLNDRGILILMDELAGFLNTFQRYTKGNDEQFYLSAWSGKPVIVDRKTSRSVRINDPIINIIGTIQPGVLEKSFNGKDESGFFDRWLLCNPRNATKGYWNDNDVSWKTQQSYDKIIENLLYLKPTIDNYENIVPNRMTYSIEALHELKQWQKSNTDFINSTSEDICKAIRAKIETYIHRFSLVCELIFYACDNVQVVKPIEISVESIQKAIDLCEYFIEQGISTRAGDPVENLPKTFRDLAEVIGPDLEFSFQDFIERASWLNIPESTARKWLKRNTGNNKIFIKIRHGVYARQ